MRNRLQATCLLNDRLVSRQPVKHTDAAIEIRALDTVPQMKYR